MAIDDRRQNVRVTFRTTTMLKFPDKIFKECETSDVSVGGAFINDIKGPKKGETCAVVFHLLGRTSNLVLEMGGEVVRVTKDGVALQFIDVDDDSFCHLKNIVFFNYKNPGDLDDEYQADDLEDEHVYQSMEIVDVPIAEPMETDESVDEMDADVIDHIRSVTDKSFSD